MTTVTIWLEVLGGDQTWLTTRNRTNETGG